MNNHQKPLLAIIILNWNNWKETHSCLDQLTGLSYPKERLQIIVVDNCSTDDSLNNLRKREGIKVIINPNNLGYAGGSNPAIQTALNLRCEFILLLNNDTCFPPDLMESLLFAFERNPYVGIVCPKIMHYENQEIIQYAGGKFAFPRIIGNMIGSGEKDIGQYEEGQLVDFAIGTCMLIRREVFELIGLLDDRFFFTHEDIDFSYRAQQAGYHIWFQPSMVVYHKISQSTRDKLPLRIKYISQARTVFFLKHIRGIRIPLVILLESLRLVRVILKNLFRWENYLSVSYIKGLFEGYIAFRKT